MRTLFRTLCLVGGLWAAHQGSAQTGLNNLWMGGYSDEGGPPWGGVDLDFFSGSLVVTTVDREIDFLRTNANITDGAGHLLFSTNGAYLANATGDTLLNGGGLSPCNYTSSFPEGLLVAQAALILPKPDVPGVYLLFHGSVDDEPGFMTDHLYLTTIDMGLDGGLGGVVSKNQVLVEDDLNIGKITAVRHANGRDWWVFCHKANTNTFYRLLVTSDGVAIDGTQSIGIVRHPDHGQVCFSPDGSRFAYYWGIDDDLEIFDFDRCSGLFSDPVHIGIDDYDQMGGVAFSPNSRFLYVSSVLDVYQYDTQADDIAGSMVHIAEWDTFYSPVPPFATMFDIAQLAPDGKVYISTGNSTLHLHVVNDPDEPGLACNLVQHQLELPRYFMNSLPNHPNYHLGPVDGSVCDSLGINTGIRAREAPLIVQAYPNPSVGRFQVSYPANGEVGKLDILDVAGRAVYHQRLPQWSQVHAVDLGAMQAGMYLCRLQWGARHTSVTVVVE